MLREQQQNFYYQQNTLPYKSPYSVVTAPKITKGTRSCPGGNTAPNYHLRRQQQRYSPPIYHPQQQQRMADIHEVSGK